jgi:hypothetical protein
MDCLLKSQFDQKLIVINYKFNNNFKSHIIIGRIREELLPFEVRKGIQTQIVRPNM